MMEADVNEIAKKQIAILEKKLERSEHSRMLLEQAKDHYDLVYRSSIERLDEQRKMLDIRNKELELLRSELLIKNEELQILSTIDGLTQIYNRMKINEKLEEEFFRAQRYQTKFAVILIDIDWFKLINDTYGHQVGDLVLFDIAQLMKERLRTTEQIGRWGGEEFLVVLPNTSAEEGYVLAERLRLEIVNYRFEVDKHLTCSFGVTEYLENDSLEQIIRKADEALYLAKEYRNCTRIVGAKNNDEEE